MQHRRTEGRGRACPSGLMPSIVFANTFALIKWMCVQVKLNVFVCLAGVLDIPMISWVVMLVSRLLDYVASVEDEATSAKKNLGGKDRERTFTGDTFSI